MIVYYIFLYKRVFSLHYYKRDQSLINNNCYKVKIIGNTKISDYQGKEREINQGRIQDFRKGDASSRLLAKCRKSKQQAAVGVRKNLC